MPQMQDIRGQVYRYLIHDSYINERISMSQVQHGDAAYAKMYGPIYDQVCQNQFLKI